MKKIVVPGGSGFLGRALRSHLPADEWEMTVLTRHPRHGAPGVTEVPWDGRTVGDWAAALEGADAVVNLAGRSISCRFTPGNRREILCSRVDSVRALGEAVRSCDQPPRVWVQASATGYYGDTGGIECDETAAPGGEFVSDVCRAWETTLTTQETPRTRRVILRLGPVLARGGGALERLAGLARRGLGGTVGNGRQYFPWIHVEDACRLVEWVISNEAAEGVYNAVAPHPAMNRDLMRELRRSVGARFGLPAPALAVRIGAPLSGVDASLALEGQRCVPARACAEGFEFVHPELRTALDDLLRDGSRD